jgi:hypothetical protein
MHPLCVTSGSKLALARLIHLDLTSCFIISLFLQNMGSVIRIDPSKDERTNFETLYYRDINVSSVRYFISRKLLVAKVNRYL